MGLMKLKFARFSLIEITLAMGVIIVGLIAIMGLIPVGQQANRDAIAKNYSADGADQLLHLLAAQLKGNWALLAGYKKDAPPNISGTASAGEINTWTPLSVNGLYFQQANPDSSYTIFRLYQTSSALGTSFDITSIVDQGSGKSRVTTGASHGYSNGQHIYLDGCADSRYNGSYTISNASGSVFDIEHDQDGGASAGGTTRDSIVVDFDAMVRVWRSPTTAWEYNGASWVSSTDSDYERRAQLNVEISWPATLKYGNRQKAFYVMEVAREE
jgi:type II secretory pathway pseudopilin PulG